MLPLLPLQRRQRIEAQSNPRLGQEVVCAYALLLCKLNELYGWVQFPPIAYNTYEKPYFPDHPQVHFNISHTRSAALVAVHDEPIGVDMERIRPMRKQTMKRLADTEDEQTFFEHWVRRESQGKRRGIGVIPRWREAVVPIANERFEPIETFPGYTACLCTCAPDADIHLECMSHGEGAGIWEWFSEKF